MIARLIEHWWPPYLRAELRMLRLDLGREQRKYDKLRTALTREAEKTAALQVEVDRMRLTAGVGIARPPAPRYNPNFTRLRQQGLPADLVEAIDEETAMKRRLDGLGDPA